MKSFENEYREMIQEEMPDLWGRIEAGLVEKQSVTQENETQEKEDLEQNKKIIMYKILKYSGLAAACICGVIVLPAMLLLNRGGSYSEQAETACTEAVTEETLTAEMPVEEAAAEEVPAEMADTEKAAVMEEVLDEMTDEEKAVATEEAPAEIAVMEGAQEEKEEMTDGAILSELTVRISEVETLKYHTIYKAVVVEDGNGVFQPEEVIEFLATDSEANPFVTGETYCITLEYDAQAEISLRLKP